MLMGGYGLSARVIKPVKIVPVIVAEIEKVVEKVVEVEPPLVAVAVGKVKRSYGLSAKAVRPPAPSQVVKPVAAVPVPAPAATVIVEKVVPAAAPAPPATMIVEEVAAVVVEDTNTVEEVSAESVENVIVEESPSSPVEASPSPPTEEEESSSLSIFTPQMTRKDITIALQSLDQEDLLSVTTEAGKRVAMSLLKASSCVIDASGETFNSEEFKKSKQSFDIAIKSAGMVGSGFKDLSKVTSSAWNAGRGDATKIETTDEYLQGIFEGLKAVFRNDEVKTSSSGTITAVATTATELGSAGGTVIQKVGSELSQSNKWNTAVSEFSKYVNLFVTSLGIVTFRIIADSKRERELPPPPPPPSA